MLQTRVARTDQMSDRELTDVRAMLDSAFDDFSDDDWAHTLGGWHVLVVDGHVLAHAAVVERILDVGGRSVRAGYVEGVATAVASQRNGLGTAVMRRIGELIDAEYELGVLSTHANPFYERLGWQRWQGPTFVRGDGQVVRTEDEDDGIMVLRLAATGDLALTLPISCDARPGDDW